MAGRFVRSSKYRHVFGRPAKKENCYDNLRISKNAWDTNLVKANPLYISVNWEAGGGGAFAVIPQNETGKLPDRIPLFRGHTATVLDTDWSPFDDSFVASGSDDGKVFLWKVPENFSLYQDGEDIEDVKPVSKLTGHTRKVGHILFNPSAKSVLASSSGDYTIKLWDVEDASAKLTLKHNDMVQSLSWSANGSLLATTCRDKKLRVWDTRQEKPAIEVPGHSGAKNSRAVWMGELDRIATTGFSRMSDRQLGLWDVRNPQSPINDFEILDQISGICMPFWDDGTQCLYLAGKGDGNIRYYEYENDRFEYLSQHSSPDPQRGVAFLPKRGVNLHENEVMRAYRTVDDHLIEPVAFIVPRRAEMFQGDIYPPTVGLKPGMSSQEFFAGKDAMPPKISLESMFEGREAEEVAVTAKPAPAPAPTPVKPPSPKPAEKPQAEPEVSSPRAVPEPTPVTRTSPTSVNDNKASMAKMADKFADKEEESSSDDTSSFEEVPKQPTRPAAAAVISAPVTTAANDRNVATNGSASPSVSTTPADVDVPPKQPTVDATLPGETSVSSAHRSRASTNSAAGSAAIGLKSHLEEIKSMLETQNKTILAQNERLDALTKEVERLKVQNAGPADNSKDERIRILELELEKARS